jgi:hypothetical protein
MSFIVSNEQFENLPNTLFMFKHGLHAGKKHGFNFVVKQTALHHPIKNIKASTYAKTFSDVQA